MKPSSKNEVMNLIVQTYKDFAYLNEKTPPYADARQGWKWFNGADMLSFEQYLDGSSGFVNLNLDSKEAPYYDKNNMYFVIAFEGELPEDFKDTYMLSTAKVILENNAEKDCIAIYKVSGNLNDRHTPGALEQYFLPMNDVGAITMIKVTATDDEGNPADCTTPYNNIKIEYIPTDETADSVLKMLLTLDQMSSTTSSVDAPTKEQFEALVKATPTDIRDTDGGLALFHDGKEISGQTNKTFKSSVTILRGE